MWYEFLDFKIHKMAFISIEGCDGSGKTTQSKLLQQNLIKRGIETVLTKEPGGSPFGEIMRNILLSNEIKDSMTEFLLLSAARRDHILEINKYLAANKWVITDRFSDSSIAYQGYAKGLDVQKIDLITQMITEGLMPDLTILLDVSIDVMQQRMEQSEKHTSFYDMKGIAFHQKIKNGFLEIAKKYPERVVIVNADKSIAEVSDEILELALNL
jgi:dTMP kinase